MRRALPVAAQASAATLGLAPPLVAQMAHAGPATTPQPSTRSVVIRDFSFTPDTTVVAPGQRIEWTNNGRRDHTVTADDGSFGSAHLREGDVFAFTAPQTSGLVPYHCSLHTFMHGSILVSRLLLQGPVVVGVGEPAMLTGQAPEVPAGTQVAVDARSAGAWSQIATAAVDGDGAFHLRTDGLTGRAVLRARLGDDLSPPLRVGIVPGVRARRRGSGAILVRVTPAYRADMVVQRLDLDTYRWRAVRTGGLPRSGRAVLRVPGPGVYRVTLRAGAGFSATASDAVTFRARPGG